MNDFFTILQEDAGAWHRQRFPEAQMEHVALKIGEEASEVGKAINGLAGKNSASGGGDVGEEAADTLIAIFVLLDRWFPEIDLIEEVRKKLRTLTTPGSHPASIGGTKNECPVRHTITRDTKAFYIGCKGEWIAQISVDKIQEPEDLGNWIHEVMEEHNEATSAS